jgi:succinate dehydrogenase/fumarate reductase flavoprotein subunit
MIGNEGKTRIVYKNYNEAGFDPDTDMLLATVMLPELHGVGGPWWGGIGHPLWRSGGGSLVVDWDLKTNLEGLFAAGGIGGGGGCAGASSTGRYVGRKVADYAKTARDPVIERKQVEEEKARVYAPVNREDGVGWKELQAGLCRIMQDYCGEYKSESILKMGSWWLNSIRESEGSRAYARNPHELWRTLECFVRLSVGEMIMHASLARKASSSNFKRLDYPEMNPPEWNKFITIKQEREKVKIGELPTNFLLLPPNAPTYEANYKEHCGL